MHNINTHRHCTHNTTLSPCRCVLDKSNPRTSDHAPSVTHKRSWTHRRQQPAALIVVDPHHEGDREDLVVPVDLVHFVCQEESIHSHREPQRRVLEENGMLESASRVGRFGGKSGPIWQHCPWGLPEWKGNMAQSGNTALGVARLEGKSGPSGNTALGVGRFGGRSGPIWQHFPWGCRNGREIWPNLATPPKGSQTVVT